MIWAGVSVAIADGIAVVVLRPDARTTACLAHPLARLRTDVDGTCAVLAGAAVWALAVWVGLALVLTVAATVPGAVGRAARAVGSRLVPATLRRVVAGTLGLGVVLVPTVAGAQVIARGPSAVRPLPAPTWPLDTAATPHHAAPTPPGPPTDPPASRRAPSPPPARTTPASPPPETRQPGTGPTGTTRVVVRPGDSLWLIAQRRLGDRAAPRDVAAAWPRWYTANRRTVGADPDLIRPGQVLRAPTHQRQRGVDS